MKKVSTLFLQVVLVLVGIGALAILLIEPRYEGVNVNRHATWVQIYFQDPFLAYAYAGSIAFFTALYQGFKLLGLMRRGEIFSLGAVRALRTVKICAMVIIAFLLGAEVFFGTIQKAKGEDIAGGVMMGLMLIFISAVVGTTAAVFERTLQSAVEMKSENDLTV